ncbi:MAG TPA: carboxymuconolactone decarboxylase family protein [Nitrolancea sp.]|nr:carboxymuconolactone decarboxylase family protein [Nitrolancea sp.]
MQPRMNHPVYVIPEAMEALQALSKSSQVDGLTPSLHAMIHLRASQINGCSACVQIHSREMKHAGETDTRIYGVAAWRDTNYYSDAERAALALTEALTRQADRPDPVSDELWNEAAKLFDEKQLAAILVSIASINVWNRLNAAVHQTPPDEWNR